MKRKESTSTRVALGGIVTALCLILMFMTGIIPFGEFAFPAFAGIVLIAIVTENGTKAAVFVYVAISLLGIFVVPSKESAMLFVFFFGYYPILQTKLQKIKNVFLRILAKFSIFNVSIVAAYVIIINVFGIADVLEAFGPFGKYSALVLLLLGNIFFAVYDLAVRQMRYVYVGYFRPRFLRRK